MYADNYTPKHAIADVLKFIAYRVKNPQADITDALLEAEQRLLDLNAEELLDVFGAALRCGISPGIEKPAGKPIKDPFKDTRGRLNFR